MAPKRITLVADNIAGAAEQIIHLLEGTDKAGDVIYFHGWYGWGASAVLKEVVKRLRSSLGSADAGTAGGLEKIIHVDFLRGQSKRALQKAIAKELELPEQVMALFDQRDEEDDFDGVEQSARGVLPHVKLPIMNELTAHRFLVVLHNWSGSYIELREVGVPLIGELGRRVLWTSRGRFWPHVTPRHDEMDDVVAEFAGQSDVAISLIGGANARRILCAEIEGIAKYTGVPEPDISLNIVIECILYRAARGNDRDINWESHASNYWVCDGIIQDAPDGGRSAWEISDALQRNMNLDFCNKCAEGFICEILSGYWWRHTDRWISVTSQNSREVEVPSLATSFFCTTVGPSSSTSHNGTMILDAGIFEHSGGTSSLRVIHLSHCTFSFSSPPFLSCSNLRFLLLDHCKDQDTQDLGEEKESHNHSQCSQQGGGACFRNLWVLELSYTDWYWLLSKDMLDLMVDLRELNVKGVDNRSMMHLHRCSGAGRNNRRLVKLRVVTNLWLRLSPPPVVASLFFPDLSSWHVLKTIILDGCGDLETIGSDALPSSLELFSLTGNKTTKIKSISFRGCTQLKSLLLRGLLDTLEELDMSGTAIKTLDFSAAQANGLMRVFLLGCEKLNAILWPQGKSDEFLKMLRIDTTRTLAAWDKEDECHKQEATISDNTSSVVRSSAALLCGNNRALTCLDWYISPRDPRIFRSLLNIRYIRSVLHVEMNVLHVEISSASSHKGSTKQGANTNSDGGGSDRQRDCGGSDRQLVRAGCNLYYVDDIISALGSSLQSGGTSNGDVFAAASVMRDMWIWHCPPIPEANKRAHCYISIHDEKHIELLLQGTTTRQLPRAITLPGFVHMDSLTLHLHDSLSITSLPGPVVDAQDLSWRYIKWCRIERCPNLGGVVFTTHSPTDLEVQDNNIFENLETFWASQLLKARCIWDWSLSVFRPADHSFENLMFLHLDYCPRLVHVLPLYTSNANGCSNLETLEIVCCGNLREVFPSNSKSQRQEEPRKFPRLKRIHMYELPKLQRICGHRMLAPNLKTVKVTGCWSLKRLPVVRAEAESSPPPEEEEESSSSNIMPLSTVDLECEKEWWDSLQWDGEEAGHHPSAYKPTYSAYYKKQHLRASVLR